LGLALTIFVIDPGHHCLGDFVEHRSGPVTRRSRQRWQEAQTLTARKSAALPVQEFAVSGYANPTSS